ncbi:hypothetical protein QN412_19330 [Pseudomonas sp. RTB3]|uniref:hypothetical protein n=1 Tax=unclassified Pseudomonas TaxID=196821 RepID=UPI002B235D60|nr:MULTISPECIES: hypothetical protein [unclassified Pseudomonas]MEB0005157.1 hypothetical protein [Pseudomonas sp. RTB2]MEB0019082.1 hypothetical protein [Pseudomonas sp. RTB3]MEB0271140.1 hypothetical protein [Pseudomonas sp. 5B4]
MDFAQMRDFQSIFEYLSRSKTLLQSLDQLLPFLTGFFGQERSFWDMYNVMSHAVSTIFKPSTVHFANKCAT